MKRRITVIIFAVCAIVLFLELSIYGKDTDSADLPVLMYHHFDTEILSNTVVSGEKFREQMTALKNAGYTSVTLTQILEFVENGTSLPDKPILITMDDGYTSNLEVAAPILEELGMTAVVFVIGINEGETLYVHSGQPFYSARFSYEEAAPWVKKGVLNLQSHSMDMHQLESHGYSGRNGMLPLNGESDETYQHAIKEDMSLFRQRRNGRVSTDLTALAYPYGFYLQATDDLLANDGILLTFTTEERCNQICIGDYSSLRLLGRYNITERISGEELVNLLNKATKKSSLCAVVSVSKFVGPA